MNLVTAPTVSAPLSFFLFQVPAQVTPFGISGVMAVDATDIPVRLLGQYVTLTVLCNHGCTMTSPMSRAALS